MSELGAQAGWKDMMHELQSPSREKNDELRKQPLRLIAITLSTVRSALILVLFPSSVPTIWILFFSFFLRFYLFMREREAVTQTEGEAGSMQGPSCGT